MQRAGIRARRENGQNFLVDSRTVDDLVESAGVRAGDRVLEIGPGLGAVTEALADRGAEVTAVEIDPRLADWLKKEYRERTEIRVIPGDILKMRLNDFFTDGSYKLVSSLPFNITSLVLRNFLEYPPRPSDISLIIQKEVAERVTATPGEMSLLSVSCQYLGQPKLVRVVPKTNFFPEPEVDAAIIHIRVQPLPSTIELDHFFRIVKIGFSAKRKMLAKNLQAGLRISREKIEEIMEKSGIRTVARPQELSIEDWRKISSEIL